MMVEYPYTEKDEIYLYAMNYSITYKSAEENLCYKGLNGPTLQLVKVGTNDAGSKYDDVSLVSGTNIVAYMEDGSLCYDPTTNKSKIDTSKIGTYKIKYEYTIDGTKKKIAERTLTVKPSKPNIDTFSIKYQNENIKDPTFDANNAILNLQARDKDGLNLKYCLVATGINDTPSVTSCNGTSDNIEENKWIDVKSNIMDIKDKTLNIKMFSKEATENKLKIYVFVKNDFEEHTSNTELNPSGIIYIIRNKLTLIYSYDSNTPNYDNKEYNLKIGENISNYLSESEITNDSNYHFERWYTDKNGNGESSDNYPNIYDDLTFYAKWYEYCSNKEQYSEGSCSCETKKKTIKYRDKNYKNHLCGQKSVTCTPKNCCHYEAICTGAKYYGQKTCSEMCPNTVYRNEGSRGPGCYRKVCS